MLDALESIRCFHVMQSVSRRHGQFTLQDLVEAGFKSFQARAFVQLCAAQRAIERRFDRPLPQGGMAKTWAVIDEFPPVRLAPADDARKVADLALSGLGRTHRDRDAIERHRRLWNGLRALRQTTASELAFACSGEQASISVRQALAYLLALATAGYAVRQRGDLFRLLPGMNTGSCPVIVRGNRVLDFNLMRAVNVNASQNGGRAA